MAHASQNFLNVLQKSIVQNRLCKFDVTEMTLALFGLPTGLAFLVLRANTEP